MIAMQWTVNEIFGLNYIILIGWCALICAPFHKASKYIIFSSAILLSIFYTLILFKAFFIDQWHRPSLNIFELSTWIDIVRAPLLLIGIIKHLRVLDLWLGRWMTYDFYSGYRFAYRVRVNSNGYYRVDSTWTAGRILFTLNLILTYLAAPFGFLVYIIAKYTFLKKYKIEGRIDMKNYQDFIERSYMHNVQPDSSKHYYVRFGDNFPTPLRQIYQGIRGVLGLLVLFTIALPAYLLLVLYCFIVYQAPPETAQSSEQQTKPNKLIPEFVRNVTATMRLDLISTETNKRKIIWRLKFLLLQLATFIEYIFNKEEPYPLFHALDDYFNKVYHTPYFTFGDGIAVGSHSYVKRYIQDIPPNKGFESLGWAVSTSQETFSSLTTVFLSSGTQNMEISRQIVFEWLHHFPHNLFGNDSKARIHLSRLVPRTFTEKPDKTAVYRAVGEVLFFMATGGELRKEERAAFVDCVETPIIFFPDWFNFLLLGNYFERRTLKCYYKLLQAFSRYTDGSALRAAFAAADKHNKSRSEALKLITMVFSIAGCIAPSKLAFNVIERLWENQEKHARLFRTNPHNFIKECARLDKAVPMVNVSATEEIASEISNEFKKENEHVNINIYPGTPIHCSIVNANHDKYVFENPDEFNPERPNLHKIIAWNGVEEDILNPDKSKRPIRYCPGHDLSIDVIQFVAERFAPPEFDDDSYDNDQTEKTDLLSNNHNEQDDKNRNCLLSKKQTNTLLDENEHKWAALHINPCRLKIRDKSCDSALDWYTTLVLGLMKAAVEESNASPVRGIDMMSPFDSPTHDLGIFRIDMAKFVPSWDEDEPNGSSPKRRLARLVVNSEIWGFHDSLIEFDSLAQAISWRCAVFPTLPVPNVVYNDMSSDEAMTQLAFTGCACHYTRRIDLENPSDCTIPESKSLKGVRYVNDMTGLSMFRVRKPFERYGAAAFFDDNFQIIAIYWSHGSRLVRKGDQFWEHVKYVWRSSFFALITISDHLISSHMIEGNAFVSASRKHLPSTHPLRIFIKPFTYHTVSINYQAAISLVNKRGLVNRIWAFDYDEFLKVCDYISIHYRFRKLPEFIPSSMTPEAAGMSHDEWDKIYPIYHDLHAFWDIIRDYVADFFKINYNLSSTNGYDHLPNDDNIMNFIYEICKQLGISGINSLNDLIDLLAQLIASSTGMHEHVGQISDYMTNPQFIGAKLQEGKEIQNVQTYTQILILSVLTGLPMPGILEDWSHLIERNRYYSENLNSYRTFKKRLQDLSENIDDRNKIRKYPFQSFNPKYIECSTSI